MTIREWESVPLGDVVSVASGLVPPSAPGFADMTHIGPESIASGGGIIRSGLTTAAEADLISGKYAFDSEAVLYSKIRPSLNKVALPDFDGICSADMYPIWAKPDALDRHYLFAVLTSEQFVAQTSSRSFRTGIPKINRDDLLAIRIAIPPLAEQRKIAEILRSWDDAIEKIEALIGHAQGLYGVLAERLVVPSQPSSRRLGETTRELTQRNLDKKFGSDLVMGVSNRVGIVPMRAQTMADDLSRYKVLPPRAFAYNPMRINVGSIAASTLDYDVVVSPDYVLFECLADELLPDYLDHVLGTRWWRHRVNAGGSGSVRTRTYYADLAAIAIHTPGVDEQRRIANLLDSCRAEIRNHEAQANLLRTQKRGLMQKLLSGEIRVAVEDERHG